MNEEPRSGGNKEVGPASEKELDKILEQASSLVKQISSEVGRSEAAPPQTQSTQTDSHATKSLDAELAELDALVASTAADLDAAQPSASAGTAPATPNAPATHAGGEASLPQKPTKRPAAHHIPDFMLEFTESASSAPEPAPRASAPIAPEQKEEAPSPPHRTVTPTKPGVVGTGMLGVVTKSAPASLPPLAPVSVEAPERTDSAALSAPEIADDAIDAPAAKPPLLPQLLMTAAGFFAALLEKADRPWAFVGERPRRLLGWIAIATMATALVLFALSVVRN